MLAGPTLMHHVSHNPGSHYYVNATLSIIRLIHEYSKSYQEPITKLQCPCILSQIKKYNFLRENCCSHNKNNKSIVQDAVNK